MDQLVGLGWMMVTALLWGVTDPLMKHYGADVSAEQDINRNTNDKRHLIFATLSSFKRWKYVSSFLLNQLGRYKISIVWCKLVNYH